MKHAARALHAFAAALGYQVAGLLMVSGLLAAGGVELPPLLEPAIVSTTQAEPTPADLVHLEELHLVGPLFEVWIDPAAKLATRLECRVLAEDTIEDHATDRRWHTPRELEPWLLEADDYTGSGYDRGHLRALAWSWGSDHWRTVNHLANIIPQTGAINRGEVRVLEAEVVRLARLHGYVDVEISIVYEQELRALQRADEAHQVPSAFHYRITLPRGDRLERVIEQEGRTDGE